MRTQRLLLEQWFDPWFDIVRQDRGPHKSRVGIFVYIRNSFKASIIDNFSTATDTSSQQL